MSSRYQVKNKQAYTPVSGRNWKERGLKILICHSIGCKNRALRQILASRYVHPVLAISNAKPAKGKLYTKRKKF